MLSKPKGNGKLCVSTSYPDFLDPSKHCLDSDIILD